MDTRVYTLSLWASLKDWDDIYIYIYIKIDKFTTSILLGT